MKIFIPIPYARRTIAWSAAISCAWGSVVVGCGDLRRYSLTEVDASDAAYDSFFNADADAVVDASKDASDGAAKTVISCGDMSGLQANSPWPTLGYCNTHVGRTNAPTLRSPHIAWTYRIGALGSVMDSFVGAPVVAADGAIYLVGYRTEDSSLQLLLLGVLPNGNLKFAKPLPNASGGVARGISPTIAADGTIYTSVAGTLTAWTQAGTVKWSRALGAQAPSSSPTILADGKIVVVDAKAIRAFSPVGDIAWTYPGDGFQFVGSVTVNQSGSLLASEEPPVGTLPGALHIVSSTGIRQLKLPLSFSPVTQPLVDELGRIVVRDPSTYYVFAPNGTTLLQKAGAGPNDPWPSASLASPYVWYTGSRGDPYVLNLDTSAVTRPQSNWSHSSAFVTYGDGSLVVGSKVSSEDRLVGLDPTGAIIRWSIVLEKTSADPGAPAVAADGTVYLPLGNVLYAVRD